MQRILYAIDHAIRTHYPYTYTETAARHFMGANTWLAKNRIGSGAAHMAGRYACDAAHYGLMLLDLGAARCHINESISRDELVERDEHECPTCGARCRCDVPRAYCLHCC